MQGPISHSKQFSEKNSNAHGSISDKDELMLKTAEFATKFIISPKKIS